MIKNKKIDTSVSKSLEEKIFVFPKEGKRIRATSLEEAQKLLDKEMKK